MSDSTAEARDGSIPMLIKSDDIHACGATANILFVINFVITPNVTDGKRWMVAMA